MRFARQITSESSMAVGRLPCRCVLLVGVSICVLGVSGCQAPIMYTTGVGQCSTCDPVPIQQCETSGVGPVAGIAPLHTRIHSHLSNHLHDNYIARKIAEHKEAKAAPPWPRFHPLPTHPALYPQTTPDISLQPQLYGGFESDAS